jgi:hypothetical protein
LLSRPSARAAACVENPSVTMPSSSSDATGIEVRMEMAQSGGSMAPQRTRRSSRGRYTTSRSSIGSSRASRARADCRSRRSRRPMRKRSSTPVVDGVGRDQRGQRTQHHGRRAATFRLPLSQVCSSVR